MWRYRGPHRLSAASGIRRSTTCGVKGAVERIREFMRQAAAEQAAAFLVGDRWNDANENAEPG
jgi:hypothetical protein